MTRGNCSYFRDQAVKREFGEIIRLRLCTLRSQAEDPIRHLLPGKESLQMLLFGWSRSEKNETSSWVARVVIFALSCLLLGLAASSSAAGAAVKPKGTEKNFSYPVLVKDAASLKGQRITHTACIFQFDSATGPKDFLAEWTNMGYGIWDNFVNVRLPSSSVGARAFEKDVVTIHGYILGNFSYQTQLGGTNTVPYIEVTSLEVVGHNCS